MPDTEIKKLKKSLRVSEMKYRTLFHNMMDGWALHEIILDENGNPIDYVFLDINSQFEKLTGLTREQVIGHRIKDILPETEDHWITRYGNVAIKGIVDEFEEYSKGVDKTFQVRAYSPHPYQFVTIFVDITLQKKLDLEKNQLVAQLQQAHKMEAIGTLAGGIAHDFNNILSAIIGYSELIKDEVDEGCNISNYIKQVFVASDRAKDLIKRILTFSRQESAVKIKINPVNIVNDAVELLKASLPSNIIIKQHNCSDIGYLYCDPIQIHQIIMNLCTNSYHAMEMYGGLLIISMCNKLILDSDIPMGSNISAGTFLQLSIADTGCGIDPEIREKVFNPYFTTKPIGKGTGMGLSMVHSIVQNHGGYIKLESVVGEGTTFNILLPIIDESISVGTQSIGNTIDDNIKSTTDNKKILLVDDEELIIEMGKIMLEKLGYHVTIKQNSLAALNEFSNDPDFFDLIITDQNMPDMTGLDLSKHILNIRPNMPIILCTGYSSFVSKEIASSIGIKGFAMKPFSKNDLVSIIQKVSTIN